MRDGWVKDIIERQRTAKRIRTKAMEVFDRSDWNEILELAGASGSSGEASAALKALCRTHHGIHDKGYGRGKEEGNQTGRSGNNNRSRKDKVGPQSLKAKREPMAFSLLSLRHPLIIYKFALQSIRYAIVV